MDRKMLEAYYIINYKPTVNKNTGLYLTILLAYCLLTSLSANIIFYFVFSA